METWTTDVAIVGGGPSGSTCAGFLKKYRPQTRVLVLERERFPRDHIGESQLPLIGRILDELGVWDRVEAAGFPIKIGGTYRWGTTDDLWDFDFLPYGQFDDALVLGGTQDSARAPPFRSTGLSTTRSCWTMPKSWVATFARRRRCARYDAKGTASTASFWPTARP